MKTLSILFLLLVSAASINAANFVVNTNLDNETNGCAVGLCTLREAIIDANGNAQPDTITFNTTFFNQARTITIAGTGTTPFVFLTDTNNTTVSNTTGFPIALSGGNVSSVVDVRAAANVTLNNLQITDGNTAFGGGAGSGIFNAGILTINNCTIFGNNSGTRAGGGIINNGTAATVLTVTNSTISGNTAATGTGISVFTGTVNLTAVTITGNTASTDGGGIANFNSTINIRNSIVAGNTDTTAPNNPDVFGAFVSTGFNLIGNSGATAATGFIATDQVGTTATPINPQFGAFGFYGGQTQTFPLLPGSPAIDKGNRFGLTNDQRFLPRPVDIAGIQNATGGDGSDIGSFEAQNVTATGVTVSGKVMTPTGKRLSRASVMITDMNGNMRYAATDRAGYFSFDEVRAGETYIFEVKSRRYHFDPQVVTITEDLSNLNFTATP